MSFRLSSSLNRAAIYELRKACGDAYARKLGTNGVPVRLAAARARRNAELAGQKTVTNLVIEANR